MNIERELVTRPGWFHLATELFSRLTSLTWHLLIGGVSFAHLPPYELAAKRSWRNRSFQHLTFRLSELFPTRCWELDGRLMGSCVFFWPCLRKFKEGKVQRFCTFLGIVWKNISGAEVCHHLQCWEAVRRCADVNPRPKVDYEKIAQRQIIGNW